MVKIARSIFAYWKINRHYQTNYIKEWVENCCDSGILIAENFDLRKEELDQQSLNCVARNKCLGQAKLIIRFPFQGFQNSMREGGHFSLFIMTKILRKQFKKLYQYNNENFVNIWKSMRCKLPYNENFVVFAKSMRAETGI